MGCHPPLAVRTPRNSPKVPYFLGTRVSNGISTSTVPPGSSGDGSATRLIGTSPTSAAVASTVASVPSASRTTTGPMVMTPGSQTPG